MLFLQPMRNILPYSLIIPFYLAGLSLILHSFIPHTHHYGNESDHIRNEVRKQGICGKNDHSNVYFTNDHHSYICHFNPQIFRGDDDLATFFLIQNEGFRFVPLLESGIIKSFYGLIGYDSIILSNQSSRAPPFQFI